MKRFRWSLSSLLIAVFIAAVLSFALSKWLLLVGKALFVFVSAAAVAHFPVSWIARKRYPGVSRLFVAGFVIGGLWGFTLVIGVSLSSIEGLLHLAATLVLIGGSATVIGGFGGMLTSLFIAIKKFKNDLEGSELVPQTTIDRPRKTY